MEIIKFCEATSTLKVSPKCRAALVFVQVIGIEQVLVQAEVCDCL